MIDLNIDNQFQVLNDFLYLKNILVEDKSSMEITILFHITIYLKSNKSFFFIIRIKNLIILFLVLIKNSLFEIYK